MKKVIWWGFMIILITAIPLIGIKVKTSRTVTPQEIPQVSQSDLPKGNIKEYEIKSGDTFVEAMDIMGVPFEIAQSIMVSSKDVFDFTKIQAKKVIKFVFVNEALTAVEYPLNSNEVIHIKEEDGVSQTTRENIPYAIEIASAKGIFNDSLF